MVPRSDLYAAQAEAKSSREEAEALARDVDSLHQQLSRVKEQCKMDQATISEMVPRSELAAAKAREEEAAALARSTHERNREAATKLETRLSGMEEELFQLRTTLKVTDTLGPPERKSSIISDQFSHQDKARFTCCVGIHCRPKKRVPHTGKCDTWSNW